MIGFVLVGTNDLRRAIEFYDKICAAFGAKRLLSDDDRVHGRHVRNRRRPHARRCSAL